MKLLIVGLGSMGKRRARLAKGIDPSIRIAGVDTNESRRAEACGLGLTDAAYPSIGRLRRPLPPMLPWSAPRRCPMRR